MKRLGAVLALFAIPFSALFANFSLLSSKPTFTALYPSVATVFFCKTHGLVGIGDYLSYNTTSTSGVVIQVHDRDYE